MRVVTLCSGVSPFESLLVRMSLGTGSPDRFTKASTSPLTAAACTSLIAPCKRTGPALEV